MSLTSWRARRLQAQQKRKALQMLALSGVVRPSDVELRFPTPLVTISPSHSDSDTPSSSNESVAAHVPESSAQSERRDLPLSTWLREEMTPSS